MDAWLADACDALAGAAGVPRKRLELADDDVAVLLDLARIAAHESGERTNAPLLCYLVGRAQGDADLGDLADAVRFAQAELGVGRVAIVDWDVHHGNGTEEIFRADDSVLFVSLHQWPFYPGTGGPDDQAETILNVPLPAGSGDDEYDAAFTRVVEPAVRAFEPELVLVSAGFDAHVDDPLA